MRLGQVAVASTPGLSLIDAGAEFDSAPPAGLPSIVSTLGLSLIDAGAEFDSAPPAGIHASPSDAGSGCGALSKKLGRVIPALHRRATISGPCGAGGSRESFPANSSHENPYQPSAATGVCFLYDGQLTTDPYARIRFLALAASRSRQGRL
jgi:hypothetical protein